MKNSPFINFGGQVVGRLLQTPVMQWVLLITVAFKEFSF
jgi:hypothetical protein